MKRSMRANSIRWRASGGSSASASRWCAKTEAASSTAVAPIRCAATGVSAGP